ncbi:hypothetical protein SAMD00019534_125070, partial [Acytostelium subglobosum LB1]|uniref:hypothetical protein n=1 Tax=Acytostelium subglobosum LB1 TaxID=1410327 RepID=UPI0006451D53
GAIVYYNSKSQCNVNSVRQTYVAIECTGVDRMVSVNEVGGCTLNFTMTAACGSHMHPHSSGIGGGWIFIIILFSSIVAYIMFGMLFNWKVRKQETLFPNVGFWKNFGSLLSDGVLYIRGKVSGTEYRGQAYQQV